MTIDGWRALKARRQREERREEYEAYIKQVVAEAPPLTNEQRDRIAALLRVRPS